MKTELLSWMEFKEITSEDLSEKSGISNKMIEKYLTGVTTPSLEVASILAKHLGISLDSLVFVNPIDNNDGPSHCIETSSIKEAIRLQNYFEENGIKVTVAVFPDDKEFFAIVYYAEEALTIKKLKHIVRFGNGYLDHRYKESEPTERYKGMIISHR